MVVLGGLAPVAPCDSDEISRLSKGNVSGRGYCCPAAQWPISLVCAAGTKDLKIWGFFGPETRAPGIPPK